MNQNFKLRLALVLAAALLSSIFLLPSIPALYSAVPAWAHPVLPDKKLKLGLDLQGGLHLVLEVDVSKVFEKELDRLAMGVRELASGLSPREVKRGRNANELAVLIDRSRMASLEGLVKKDFGTALEVGGDEGNTLFFELRPAYRAKIQEEATRQAIETIRNRIDQFGVSEPSIQKQGEQRIVVQLPGLRDPGRAIELIGTTAVLEFKMVDRKSLPQDKVQALVDRAVKELGINPQRLVQDETAKLNEHLKFHLPPGTLILFERRSDAAAGKSIYIPYLVREETPLGGDQLSDARVQPDPYGVPQVNFEFKPAGAKIFGKLTADNVGEYLAIVLDGMIYSAPAIQGPIPEGRGQITGSFTYDEARDLAIVLRAGSLPAPVTILENRTVGPSLGQDSIRKGFYSMLIGGLAVLVFMVVYYNLSGFIADFALFFNVLFMLAVLAAFQATLTLPGIAGIVLTVGMAVDANVIIFERIREELRAGRPPRMAVDAGYEKAFSAIWDGNITTLIAGLVLFQYGTGPVRGFATTLNVGIVTTLFTAIVIPRLIHDWMVHKLRVERLSI